MTKEKTILVKDNGISQKSEDFLQVYKALTVDAPLASLRWAFGSSNDKDATVTLWKGYDAGVRLATSTIDSLYRSQSLSEIVGTTVNQMLRIQQLTNAASRFFMTGLLQPVALPGTPARQSLATPTDTHLSEATPARTQTTTRRTRQRKTRVQEPVPTPAYLLPRQQEFQAAA